MSLNILNSNKKSSRKAKILPQFSISSENKPLLDLLEIQRKSFFDFLQHGIPHELTKIAVFRETAKNSTCKQELELKFNPETYKFISPSFTPKEAILNGKTYACKIYVQATLTIQSPYNIQKTNLFSDIEDLSVMAKRRKERLNFRFSQKKTSTKMQNQRADAALLTPQRYAWESNFYPSFADKNKRLNASKLLHNTYSKWLQSSSIYHNSSFTHNRLISNTTLEHVVRSDAALPLAPMKCIAQPKTPRGPAKMNSQISSSTKMNPSGYALDQRFVSDLSKLGGMRWRVQRYASSTALDVQLELRNSSTKMQNQRNYKSLALPLRGMRWIKNLSPIFHFSGDVSLQAELARRLYPEGVSCNTLQRIPIPRRACAADFSGTSKEKSKRVQIHFSREEDDLSGMEDVREVTQNTQVFRPWIFLGELPLMTKRGHFILNGSPRVIVNQIARCPGIYFQEKRRGVGIEQEIRVSADLIPQRGPWLRIQSDWEGRFWARLKQEGRVKYAILYEAFQEFEKEYNPPLICLLSNSYFTNTNTTCSLFSKSENVTFQERKIKEDRQKKALIRLFKNSSRYSLGKLGRFRINERIHFSFTRSSHATAQASSTKQSVEGVYFSYPSKFDTTLGNLLYKSDNNISNELPLPCYSSNSNEPATHISAAELLPHTSHPYRGIESISVGGKEGYSCQEKICNSWQNKFNNEKSKINSCSMYQRSVEEYERGPEGAPLKCKIEETDSAAPLKSAPHATLNRRFGKHGQWGIRTQGKIPYKGRNPMHITSSVQSSVSLARRVSCANEVINNKINGLITSNSANYIRLANNSLTNRKNVLQILRSKNGSSTELNSTAELARRLYPLPLSGYRVHFSGGSSACAARGDGVQLSAGVGGEPLLQQHEELMAKDLDAIHTCLERLLEGQGFTDDIDNLKNRFIRTSGKLLQQQFELGLFRLNEVIMPLLGNLLPDYPRLTKNKYSSSLQSTISDSSSLQSTVLDSTNKNTRPIVDYSSHAYPPLKWTLYPDRGKRYGVQLVSKTNPLQISSSTKMNPSGNKSQICYALDQRFISDLLGIRGNNSTLQYKTNRRFVPNLVSHFNGLNQIESRLFRPYPIKWTAFSGQSSPSKDTSIFNNYNKDWPFVSNNTRVSALHTPSSTRITNRRFVTERACSTKMQNRRNDKFLAKRRITDLSIKDFSPIFHFSGDAKQVAKRRIKDLSADLLQRSVGGVQLLADFSGVKSPICQKILHFRGARPLGGLGSGSAQVADECSNEVSLVKNTPFRWLRTSKPINSAFREFFGSNPLSQYMDQTNPLAEITHKRRLSSMGPGGIKRETAGMEVRGIHPTHYGRVCPIETPEGKNAGLVNSPTVYGRVGNYGFLETPLYQVIENQVQTKRWTFFSAQHEEKQNSSLATCDTGLLQFNFLAHVPIPVQTANNPLTHFQQVERHRVGYRALSPIQTISIATALIPFLEHDDANRALMGSNMQRQAIPLLLPERPIVGTGFEPLVVMESGQALQATKLGCVSQADANSIIVHTNYSIEKPISQNILQNSTLPWSTALRHRFASTTSKTSWQLDHTLRSSVQNCRAMGFISVDLPIKFSFANCLLAPLKWIGQREDPLRGEREYLKYKIEEPTPPHTSSLQRSSSLVRIPHWGKAALSGSESQHFSNKSTDKSTIRRFATCYASPPYEYPVGVKARYHRAWPIKRTNFSGASLQTHFSDRAPLKCKIAEISSTKISLYKSESQHINNKSTDKSTIRRFATCYARPYPPLKCTLSGYRACFTNLRFVQADFSGGYASAQKFVKTHNKSAICYSATPLKSAPHATLNRRFSSLVEHGQWGIRTQGYSYKLRSFLVGSDSCKSSVNKKHISYSHNTFLLQPLKQDLQFYERSNQETCLNQRPLVQEGDWIQKGDFLADSSASRSGDLALGKNVTVAYMPWEGYNFEDAIVISDRLVSEDIYTSLHIERYEIKVSKNSQGKERITNRVPGSSHSLKHLDNFGIARISSWVQPGDILVGKVVELKRPLSPYERLAWELASRLSPKSPEREKWLNKVWLEDISLRLPPGVCGRVINSQIISTEHTYSQGLAQQDPSLLGTYPSTKQSVGGGTMQISPYERSGGGSNAELVQLRSYNKEQIVYPQEVHIYLAVKRKIQIGDKLAGRHGNKGIVSAILPQEDMPYLGDGSCIDMVLNPLGVPSRMNLGQIFECLLGLAGSQLGCNFRITPFDEIAGGEASRSLVFLKLYQCRLMYKQQWLFTPTFPGKSKLFDGRTGEPFENWVTVGQAYMLKLIHMVDHKIHARSTGPYSLFTRQPVRGRSRRGGQRLGEMEVWAVEGFGAAYTLQEFLTIKSDDLKARTALQKGFYKQNDVTFGKIHIAPGNPEAFKVLVSELQALCLHIQM